MKLLLLASVCLTLPASTFAETNPHVDPDSIFQAPENQAGPENETLTSEFTVEKLDPPYIAVALPRLDYTVGIYDFTAFSNVDQTEERITSATTATKEADTWAMAPLQLPKGVQLTSMMFFGTDTTTAGGMIMELRRKNLLTNEIETVKDLRTFTTTAPLMVDLAGNIRWNSYGGTYPHAFSHYYWNYTPMGPLTIYHYDRDLETDLDHKVSHSHTYYLYIRTVGEVDTDDVQFWSAGFTYE